MAPINPTIGGQFKVPGSTPNSGAVEGEQTPSTTPNTPPINNNTKEENAEETARKAQYTNEDLDKPYVDNRKVVISLVKNYSNYRQANHAALGKRVSTIGSSITSCQVLSSNAKEVEKYFPTIIGLSPNNQDFVTRVKAWLSNIQITVNDNDKIFDCSFRYNHKRDYLEFAKREQKIEDEYAKVDRANVSAIKEACRIRSNALNQLESEKYAYGDPINVVDYLMYRHCLLYHDVAKDEALINSDASLRFFIKDEAKETRKRKRLVDERFKAMNNFIELSSSEEKFNAVFIVMAAYRNESISTAMVMPHEDKARILMDFVNTNPDKFNKFVTDKNVMVKAFIERLIVNGELHRTEYNQQISDADGNFIASNLNEAVAYFTDPAHKDIRTAYENKLKLLQ